MILVRFQDERTQTIQLENKFLVTPLNILAEFTGANMTMWKQDQQITVFYLAILAWIGFSF